MKHPLRLYTIDGPARAVVDLNTREPFGRTNWVMTDLDRIEWGTDDLLTEDEAKACAKAIRDRNETCDLDSTVRVVGWGTVEGDKL